MKSGVMKQSVKKLLLIGVMLVVFYAGLYLVMAYFRYRAQEPTLEASRKLVQAIVNYRAERGLLPEDLKDLSSEQFSGLGNDYSYGYSRHAEPPYVYVSKRSLLGPAASFSITYEFDPYEPQADPGIVPSSYYSADDFSNVDSTVPELPAEDLAKRRLVEFDRLIEKYSSGQLKNDRLADWYRQERAKFSK